MRLHAIEFPAAVTGGDPGFVRLSAITLLLGANDTGKSRMLRSIARALDLSYPERPPLAERPRLFVELDQSARRWLDEERDHAGRREVPFLRDRSLFGRALDEDRLDTWRLLDEAQARGLTDALDHQLFILRERARLGDAEWDPLFDALRRSRYAAVAPVQEGWTLQWCLPPWHELDEQVRELVQRLDVKPERDDEPIVATPLLPWVVGDQGLPRVRVVPRADPISEYGDFSVEPLLQACPEPIAATVWVATVRRLFARLVTARLPRFVTSQYGVGVDERGVPRFERWRGGAALAAEEMADGFRVWIEIALIDAYETLKDAAMELAAILSQRADWPHGAGVGEMLLHLKTHGHAFSAMLSADPDTTVERLLAIAPLLARARRTRDAYSYVGSSGEDPLTIIAGSGEQSGSLFLIDEPERHLHPRLQRQAARWLQGVADENLLHGQILMATHAVSLMGLSRSVAYTEVRRPHAATVVVAVGPRKRDLMDTLSNELGLTRGELITLRRLFLFVEGAVDKLAFEGLFGERLRDAGVEVIAMHGTTKMQAIIESDLLFGSYRQPIAVIVDNIVQGQLPGPREIAALERLCGKQGTNNQELRKAAELYKNAYYAGREVALEAIPTPDIIAELDAEVIRAEQDTNYPGYAVAHAEWTRANSKQNWKGYCIERGWLRAGVDDITPVVDEMRRRRIQPPEMARLVAWAERLAAEVSD